jgi:pimeloyl-ACP methyl ester carboxylesterase
MRAGAYADAGERVDPAQEEPLEQSIKFCTTPDGVRLAYATSGKGPPIVKTANWFTHLEYEWHSPVWRHVLEGLSERRTLVRYDMRGTGLSDRNPGQVSFESYVTDLATAAEAAGYARFPLFGISQGGAVSIAYAVRHPDRVSHLILYGAYALGMSRRSGAGQGGEAVETYRRLIRDGWGSEDPVFRQVFSGQFMPDGTPEQLRWYSELERVACSAEHAERSYLVNSDVDVTNLLAQVNVPTLILHCRGDRRVPFDMGRELAARIAGAKLVTLESNNHLLLGHEPAAEVFFREIAMFLGDPAPTAWKRTLQGARLQAAAQKMEANPIYKLAGAIAVAATLVSFVVWLAA